MDLVDTINGMFVGIGGIIATDNIRVILNDRQVKGVSIPMAIFFTVWSIWSLYFYASLNKWMSLIGGGVIAAVDVVWVYYLLKYRGK